MWTTKIINIGKGAVSFDMVVEFYKDGVLVQTFTFVNIGDPDSIKARIQSQLNQYKRIDELDTTALLGDVDLTDIPTKEQNYQIKEQELFKAKQYLNVGLMEQVDYDILLNEVKNLK